MEKPRKIFAGVLLLVLSVGMCLAQHWSFGLQPGGKRSTKDLLGPFQEITSDIENFGEVQQSQCPGPSQHSQFRELQEAVVS
ncbi:GON1 protein, partial [Campylorhamphus procurvoides]|nr:GON1 protein [Campylorhamphus procurvoides]